MQARFDDKKLVLYINGDLVASKVKNFEDKAKQFTDLKGNYDDIILDLIDVKIIDSIGISFIIGLYNTAAGLDKGFKIVHVNKDLRQLFKIMKLDEVMFIENP